MNIKGRRLVIAYNPHSSRARDIETDVFQRLKTAGYTYVSIEVHQASLADNVRRLSPQIEPRDIILCAAGDGSAHAMSHAIMAAGQTGVEIGFLAFGNFNDLPHTFNTHRTLRDPVKFLELARAEKIYPLQVSVDGRTLRQALLYVTIGWTARAASRFDEPNLRHKVKHGGAGLLKSIWRLGWYYLGSRRSSLLPSFRLRDIAHHKTTDLIFANGPTVARLFRSGKPYYRKPVFLYRKLDVRRLITNLPFLIEGLIGRMPGEEVKEALIEFDNLAVVPLQCDGEAVELKDVRQIEIRKYAHSLTVLTTK